MEFLFFYIYSRSALTQTRTFLNIVIYIYNNSHITANLLKIWRCFFYKNHAASNSAIYIIYIYTYILVVSFSNHATSNLSIYRYIYIYIKQSYYRKLVGDTELTTQRTRVGWGIQ